MAMEKPTLDSLLNTLSRVAGEAFAAEGADPSLGRVIITNRPDLCDLQTNGVFAAAKALHKFPQELATNIAERLRVNSAFHDVSVEGAYLNITLSDDLLLAESDLRLEALRAAKPLRIVVDYG